MGSGFKRGVLGPIDRLVRTGTTTGLSDGQLLERFTRRHDEAAEAAFAALMERHGPMVLGVCHRVLNDPHDAQDAFQATFLVLVRKAGAVRNRESVADWLHGVARRVSAHARAASARRREVEWRAGASSSPAYETNPTDLDVWDEVECLPRDLRAPVVLCYLEGLTHEQAAQRLGWPVGTVRSRLARARDRLRTRLTRRGLAPGAALVPMLSFKAIAPPEGLIDPTVKAAMLIVARDAAEAGLVSASAATITEGVLRTMLISKLKTAAIAAIAAGTFAAGAGVYAYQDDGPVRETVSAAPPTTSAGSEVDREVSRVQRSTEGPPIAITTELERLARDARRKHDVGDHEGASRDIRRIRALTFEWFNIAWPTSPRRTAQPGEQGHEQQGQGLGQQGQGQQGQGQQGQAQGQGRQGQGQQGQGQGQQGQGQGQQGQGQGQPGRGQAKEGKGQGQQGQPGQGQGQQGQGQGQQGQGNAQQGQQGQQNQGQEGQDNPASQTLAAALPPASPAAPDATKQPPPPAFAPTASDLRIEAAKQQPIPAAFAPTASDLRMDELERKIDRILQALEADGARLELKERVRPLSKPQDAVNRETRPAGHPPIGLEGTVQRFDTDTNQVEITIGSDDGLVPGQEMHLYRPSPEFEYLGKIRIQSTDPDQAVGELIGRPAQGTEIKKGDRVLPEFRTR